MMPIIVSVLHSMVSLVAHARAAPRGARSAAPAPDPQAGHERRKVVADLKAAQLIPEGRDVVHLVLDRNQVVRRLGDLLKRRSDALIHGHQPALRFAQPVLDLDEIGADPDYLPIGRRNVRRQQPSIAFRGRDVGLDGLGRLVVQVERRRGDGSMAGRALNEFDAPDSLFLEAKNVACGTQTMSGLCSRARGPSPLVS
jgi:hypothetical protein